MKPDRINIELGGENAHFFKLNEQGKNDAHFYPGNGLPVGVYEPLLGQLSKEYNLTSLALRASWIDSKSRNSQVNWSLYAEDLILFIEKHYSEPIVGIGHSQGADATVIAAAKRPDLFKELFLIEPVSTTFLGQVKIRLVPYSIKKRLEPFKSALKRKATWSGVGEYFDFLRSTKAYRRMSDENLMTYATNSLFESSEGRFEFVFPLDWEVANYALPVHLDPYLNKLKIPFKIILGKPSVFSNEKVREKWKLDFNSHLLLNTEYGHLIPLEAPYYCASSISGLSK